MRAQDPVPMSLLVCNLFCEAHLAKIRLPAVAHIRWYRNIALCSAAVADDARLQLHVVFQGSLWFDAKLLQNTMVGAHRFLGRDFAVGDEPQKADKRELIFGVVDLAAKERDASAIFFCLAQKLKGIIC